MEPRLLETRGMGMTKRKNLATEVGLLLPRALGSAVSPQRPVDVVS